MMRRVLIGSGIVIAAMLAGPRGAAAFCRLTTVDPPVNQLCSSEGIPLVWWDRCSTVQLLPRNKQDIPQQTILDTLQTAFDHWGAVRCEDGAEDPLVGLVTVVSDEPASEEVPAHRKSGPNENVVMFVDSRTTWLERDNVPQAIGLTSVFHSKQTGRIFGVDMEINDWRGTLGICGTRCPTGITDLENVLTHEAGHYYGLGHVADDTATMYGEAPPGDIAKRDLAQDDADGLCDAYPPGTFSVSCTGSTYSRAHEDNGCNCSVTGARRRSMPWGAWLLIAAAFGVGTRRRLLRRHAGG